MAPWTEAQKRTARAVEHGFEPTGKAKGFSRAFAEQVTVESNTLPTRKKRKKAR